MHYYSGQLTVERKLFRVICIYAPPESFSHPDKGSLHWVTQVIKGRKQHEADKYKLNGIGIYNSSNFKKVSFKTYKEGV